MKKITQSKKALPMRLAISIILTGIILVSASCKKDSNKVENSTPVKSYHVKLGTVTGTTLPRLLNLSTGKTYLLSEGAAKCQEIDIIMSDYYGALYFSAPASYYISLGSIATSWDRRRGTSFSGNLDRIDGESFAAIKSVDQLHSTCKPQNLDFDQIDARYSEVGATWAAKTFDGKYALIRLTEHKGNFTDTNSFIEIDVKTE